MHGRPHFSLGPPSIDDFRKRHAANGMQICTSFSDFGLMRAWFGEDRIVFVYMLLCAVICQICRQDRTCTERKFAQTDTSYTDVESERSGRSGSSVDKSAHVPMPKHIVRLRHRPRCKNTNRVKSNITLVFGENERTCFVMLLSASFYQICSEISSYAMRSPETNQYTKGQ